jgi:hypothetical protein
MDTFICFKLFVSKNTYLFPLLRLFSSFSGIGHR